jgi:hypothetical protein
LVVHRDEICYREELTVVGDENLIKLREREVGEGGVEG